MFAKDLGWRQRAAGLQQGFPAIPRPAGGRDRRAGAGGGGRHRRRAGRRACQGSRAFHLGAPAGCLAVPAQGGVAVPGQETAFRPDGPDDRRAAVPWPARRRSHRARPVFRAVAARHGRHQGRRRPGSLCRIATGVPPGDGGRAGRPSAPAVVAAAAGRRAQRPRRQIHVRAGAAEAGLRRAAAGRRGDRGDAQDHRRPGVREVRRGARAHHRPGRAGRRGVCHRRAGRGGRA